MYYLVQTNEMWGYGGSVSTVKLFKKAMKKELLTEFLEDEFYKAIKDKDVEFINDCEKCCVDVEDINNELSIQYIPDGWDYNRIKYNIVSDSETELIEEPSIMVKCKDCGKIIPEEDANYCHFEEDSDYICDDCLEHYEYCEVCETYYPSEKEYIYFLRGGSVCEDCYDDHGWRYE